VQQETADRGARDGGVRVGEPAPEHAQR
jgi:hypothetical protein